MLDHLSLTSRKLSNVALGNNGHLVNLFVLFEESRIVDTMTSLLFHKGHVSHTSCLQRLIHLKVIT